MRSRRARTSRADDRTADSEALPAQEHDIVMQGAANASRREDGSSNLGKFLSSALSPSAAQQEIIRQAQRVAKEKFLAQQVLHASANANALAARPADSMGINGIDNKDASAAAAFAAAKKRFKRKKDSGELTQTDEIEFMRLERAERERLDRLDEWRSR